ncbi:hypothetical protein I7I53_01512 [Histoplasma capsulatum var. duboisii H88]|uniref:Uncharacterized protein n=1 Tax=Ajellomyces capsulatus (strain H88) TaxID=544711 RepID=A0A8A1LNN9_AJEC8|nr:hypothetical protein I7I53_01512 [Histoplasma capsulatum var. duboisii H88]
MEFIRPILSLYLRVRYSEYCSFYQCLCRDSDSKKSSHQSLRLAVNYFCRNQGISWTDYLYGST